MGPEATCLDVGYTCYKLPDAGYTWYKRFVQGIKGGGWSRTRPCCMHWHALGSRRLGLSLGLFVIALVPVLVMATPSQTHRFVCVACQERGTFTTTYPTARAVKIHIGKSTPCRAAELGVREIVLETRPTDAMVGGTGAAGPAPILRHQPPGWALQCQQKVGVGVYYRYTMYILSI